MAHLGVLVTRYSDDDELGNLSVFLGTGRLNALEQIDNTQPYVGDENSVARLGGTDVWTLNVVTYPYTMNSDFRDPQIGKLPSLGRARKSIRGLAQDQDAHGISRKVYALDFDPSGGGRVIAYVTSTLTSGVFDIRVPTAQPVTLIMESNGVEPKNDPILDNVTPVDPV